MKNIENWNNFIKEFSEKILPIYEHHESTFDTYRVHGRLHISRSIIFAEFMTRYYNELRLNVDFDAIRYAVSFHDAGRKGNGIDLWEADSSNLCLTYLSEKYDLNYCKYIANLIKKDNNLDINKKIVIDADVLEIMRPVCGHGGIDGFNSKYFNFSPEHKEIRNNLINDAWKLIKYTEDNQNMFTGNDHLYQILDILDKNRKDYILLDRF